jgi:glycerol-3-phosphate cytidylyltransferase-like family protein
MKIGMLLVHSTCFEMLEDAKRQCDYLIAALQTDPQLTAQRKNRPTQSVVERYIQLKGCVHGMKSFLCNGTGFRVYLRSLN